MIVTTDNSHVHTLTPSTRAWVQLFCQPPEQGLYREIMLIPSPSRDKLLVNWPLLHTKGLQRSECQLYPMIPEMDSFNCTSPKYPCGFEKHLSSSPQLNYLKQDLPLTLLFCILCSTDCFLQGICVLKRYKQKACFCEVGTLMFRKAFW